MRFVLLILLTPVLLSSTLLISFAVADQRVKDLLSKWNVKVREIHDLGSLYEVVVQGDPKIIYFTKDLRYMILGGVFDPKTGKNLTAERLREYSKVDIGGLRKIPHVSVSYGSGPTFYAFVDADCPYCHKFLRWAKENGANLHLYFFPIHDYNKNLFVLCEGLNGKGKEMVERMLKGNVPKKEKDARMALCEGTLKEHINKARALGVRGTPYIIAEDGTVIQGFVPQLLEKYGRR